MKISNLFLAGSHTAFALADNHQPPTAKVDAGTLVGKSVNLPAALGPVNQFLGVPFAQSPPERFSPAKPVARSERRINATDYKPSCIQQFRYPLASQQLSQSVFNNPAPDESEDCLYLNVFAPAERPGGRGRPVMFWIYGGGLGFGNAGQPSYEGTSFAAYEDVIVVTANYRTNVFGFPGSPELRFTERNLGFLDQRLALDWVQRNIHAFGGDPSKVTIFGESAGGYSIDALLTSYPKNSKPPYRAAILQSGQFTYRSVAPISTFPTWNNLTAALGCPGNYANNLTCVRAANATTIKKIIEVNILTFAPTLDNVTLVSDPAARRVSGNIAHTPVLGGTNAQEGRIFTYGQNNLTAYLQAAFGATPYAALIPTIIAAYPKNGLDLRDDFDIIAQIYTELGFQCPQALWANATAAIGIPTWRYYFNASFINTQGVPNLGAYHGSEVQLIFGTYRLPNTTTQEYALGRSMQATWARFAKNPYAGPGWNALGSGGLGAILTGTNDYTTGGLLINNNVTVVPGDWNLGVFGDIGLAKSAGVTVLPQSLFDRRCALWKPIYEAVVGKEGMPPI